MKCILYGIGSGRLKVERYLKNEHNIVGYSDSFAEYEKFNDKKFYKPQELFTAECDFIIICIGDKKNRQDVIYNLKKFKVNSKKYLIFMIYTQYILKS